MLREFVLFSNRGWTSGNFKDLMKAGRLDIVAHSVIASLFVSNAIRVDTKLHVVLNGPPDPPKHIIFEGNEKSPISKKDVGDLLRYTLWKYKKGKVVKAFEGIYIEKKSFNKLLEEFKGRNVYLLDRKGKSIEEVEILENPVFILGDHEGLPKREKKLAKKISKEVVSIGPLDYFTSQTIVIVQNFLDKKFGAKIVRKG